ncbi:ACT-like protein [Ramicandelaber brevisporus]|nr:ACT-like protein [Ramicandelaber brevisporus]
MTGTTSAATVRIGFQGIHGAFSDGAAKKLYSLFVAGPLPSVPLFSSKNCKVETVPFATLDALVHAVQNGQVDHIILPLENILTGTLTAHMDLLMRSRPQLHITGELVNEEKYCLLAPKGSKLEDITEVWSHPDVLAQCERFVDTLPAAVAAATKSKGGVGTKSGVLSVHGNSTASCAQDVALGGHLNRAAIASKETAALFDLSVLVDDIAHPEAAPHNLTRYVIVSRSPIVPERHLLPKTSLAVVVQNRTGTLFKTMGCFAMRDINVCKIDARPSARSANPARMGSPWEYTILVDIDGSSADDNVRRALEHLREFAREVHVLGSYPRYTSVYSSSTDSRFGIGG